MKLRGFATFLWCALILISFLAVPSRAKAEDWLPIDPQDLAMKDNPKHPGDHAMILWREDNYNDLEHREDVYVRIKIFDEQGRDCANVETEPYEASGGILQINGVRGRTIHPDGSIVVFSDKVYEKAKSKYRWVKFLVKTFTLPEVTPGSIIEYKYTWSLDWQWSEDVKFFFTPHWLVQDKLFQRQVHFTFRPNPNAQFAWNTARLPAGSSPVKQQSPKGEYVVLDLKDVPGYEVEPLMPPEDEVRARVDFFYIEGSVAPTSNEFWRDAGKKWGNAVEGFLGKKSAVAKEAEAATAGGGSDEEKLRKLYDRVQAVRNLTYAPEMTVKEYQREKFKRNKSAEDVFRNGYGWHNELNRAFVALARAAGFDATLVKLTAADRGYFNQKTLDDNQLTWEIALVRVGGKELYLDSGTRFCPFGILPWEVTSPAAGLRLDKKPPAFVQMALAEPESALIQRKGNFKLSENGALEGDVEVTFSGQEAMNMRLDERHDDEAARKKDLEDLLRQWLLGKGSVTLQNVNDWDSSKVPLVATFHIAVPSYANVAGRRAIMSTAVFSGAWRSPFLGGDRQNAVVFPYPYVHSDEVTISLPAGMKVDALPEPKQQKNVLGEFSVEYRQEDGVLRAKRQFRLERTLVKTKYYDGLNLFFGQIADTSDEQVVLKTAGH